MPMEGIIMIPAHGMTHGITDQAHTGIELARGVCCINVLLHKTMAGFRRCAMSFYTGSALGV